MELGERIEKIRRIETYLEQESMLLAESSIDVRLKMKKVAGEKVRVLFICHRPQVWNSLKTVYEAFRSDPAFETMILAVPNKKQLPEKGLGHEEYESEGAEEFWKEYGCIDGYDYEKREWLDLRDLYPDYVFFQQPYNITRPAQYKSWIVSKYAKLCYVSYGYQILGNELFDSMYPADFMKAVSFYFAADQYYCADISQKLKTDNNHFTRIYTTGFPRFDLISPEAGEEKDMFCALWTPRWSTEENNCFFFEYKDKLLTYCDKNERFSLIFRPHPQAFLNWNATGELPEKEADAYRLEYERRENARIDESGDYLTAFQASDCLIADATSLMTEYFLTGKPIIYCHRVDWFTVAGKKMAEGFYWVRSWEELCAALEMLRRGEDPLKEKRQEIIREFFPHLRKICAGYEIKEIIKRDALK